ncbi:MAG TPA: cytochrome c [Steroidobacteraceae bacterium]|nr:cytochrome c [Steroidobacteraceae bacterium]
MSASTVKHSLRGAMLVIAAALGSTTATAADPPGKALYAGRCGMCHQTIGMAVGILSRRPADPSKGLLEQREDLSAAFITAAVRGGINNMPRISRAEVSDPELAQIAGYLAKGRP